MAFLDHNGESEFPINKNDVFDAMCKAIPTIKGMKVENADKLQGRILVKSAVSLYSWGENIPIQLLENGDNKTKVQITSSPKTGIMFGGAFDMGKNRKNIENILSATSNILQQNINRQTTQTQQTNIYQTSQQQPAQTITNMTTLQIEQEKKKMGIGKKILIGFGILILFIAIRNCGNETKIDSKNTTVNENTNAAQPSDTIQVNNKAEAIVSKWNYNESEDKMTSKKIITSSITANEELEFDFPYNGGSVATFTIRKKNGSTDIYLQVSKGQFNSTFDGGQIKVRFDDKPVKKYSFTGASDASSDIIFINSVKDIISKIKTAKKMLIETEFYNEGNRQMEFDIADLKWE